MSLSVDDLVKTDSDGTRRDKFGRYLVLPPGGKKPVPYTRATTIAKAIDDMHSLVAWKARMTAIGLTRRPELLKLIAVTDDRNQLDKLCEDAAASGGATERRDEGTALHRAIELSLRGELVPDLFRGDVNAVRAALTVHGFTFRADLLEAMVVDDARRIAGRFDLAIERNGRTFIADIKTGASLDYSGGSFAAQLAIYAGADCRYRQGLAADGSQDERHPLPALARDVAYILHVQPGTARCDIHAVDIGYGAELVDLNLTVREARNRSRKLITKLAEPSPPIGVVEAVEAPVTVRPAPGASRPTTIRGWIMQRVEVLKHIDTAAAQLVAMWPAGVPGLKSGHVHTDTELDLIEAAVTRVERNFDAPFTPGPLQPQRQWVSQLTDDPFIGLEPAPFKPVPQPATLPDEGGPVDDDDIALIETRLSTLTTMQRAWCATIAQQAVDAGAPIALKQHRSERRFAIVAGVIAWADYDDELVRAGLEHVLDTALPDDTTTGAVIATLTIGDALTWAELAGHLNNGTAAVTIDNNGTHITPNPNQKEPSS